jgi:O-antigen/teichoic acid export membrane protein
MPSSRKLKVISLSLSQGILIVVSLVSGMVFARTLTVADYGTYLQTFLAYDFAASLLTLGLSSALFYFLPGAKERQKTLVLENILLLFFAGAIFSLFLIFGGTELLSKRFNNPDLSKTLRWMILYPLYTFPVVLGAVLVIKDKVNLNAVYNVITGIILTAGLIIAAIVTKSYEVPILVRILIPALFFPVVIYLSFKYVPGKWEKPSFSSMWQIIKFAVPLGLASVLATITLQLSNIIISFLCTPEDFAVYSNGAKELPVVGIITGSIAIVIMADMSQKIKEGDKKGALELFRKASVISACFLLPAMCFSLFYADNFIDILYTKKYANSVLPFRIYLFMLPMRIVYYGSAFIALGRSKAVLYRSAIELIISAILCFFLVKWLGAYSAALALVLTSYFWSLPYNLYTLGKEFSCKPDYVIPIGKIGKVLLVSLISGIISSTCLLIRTSSIFLLCIGLTVYIAVYFTLAYNFIPEFKEITFPYLPRLSR